MPLPAFGPHLSPDGNLMAVVEGKTVRLRSKRTDREFATLGGHAGNVTDVRFSPDSRLIMTESSADKVVRLWETNNGFPVLEVPRGDEFGFGSEFSPDSRWLVVKGNKVAGLWDLATRRRRVPFPATATAVFSPDSKWIALVPNSFADKQLYVYDVRSGKERAKIVPEEKPFRIQFTPDSRCLLGWGGDSIRVWTLRSVDVK